MMNVCVWCLFVWKEKKRKEKKRKENNCLVCLPENLCLRQQWFVVHEDIVVLKQNMSLRYNVLKENPSLSLSLKKICLCFYLCLLCSRAFFYAMTNLDTVRAVEYCRIYSTVFLDFLLWRNEFRYSSSRWILSSLLSCVLRLPFMH